jgi:pilus assembly protein CpaE
MSMQRPTVLLAMLGGADAHAEALRRAGFEPITVPNGDMPPDTTVDLAVLDCDLPDVLVVATYNALGDGPRTPAILLVNPDSPQIPDGIGGGSVHDEVALKPIEPEALIYRLQALMIRSGRGLPAESGEWAAAESLSSAPVAGEGHVVTVYAPKGGVGKTTVAVNLAVALRQQTRASVLLLDADIGVGNVTAVLDVRYRVGLTDLGDDQPPWPDEAFEQAVATHAASGVRVLAWGHDPGESERVTPDLLIAALSWARRHHQYVVVDTHPGYDDRTMAMLTLAKEIFLVVTPEMGSVRGSSQFLQLAREVGLGDVVRVVVNRANHGIRLPDISSALRLPISATVVSSGPRAVIASNEGTPIVLKFPRDKIATDLHGVARLISQPGAAATPSPAPGRRWWKLGNRPSSAVPTPRT